MTASIVVSVIVVVALSMFVHAALTYEPPPGSLGAYLEAEVVRLESLNREREVMHMERDLLDTDPREWVRQAEQAVERAENGKTDLIASVMQMARSIAAPSISTNEYAHRLSSRPRHEHQWVDSTRMCDPAPRFACVTCGTYDVPHTHDMEDQ